VEKIDENCCYAHIRLVFIEIRERRNLVDTIRAGVARSTSSTRAVPGWGPTRASTGGDRDMTRHRDWIVCALALLASAAAAADRPNVVVILADDMGYADVSAYRAGRIPTPNIDGLAAGGVRFTDGYVAAPVCSPSRAALMTGRYQQRFGFEFNNGPAERDVRQNLGLPKGEIPLAAALKPAGYRTALVGKWHLGSNPDFYPTNRGFDEFFGILTGATLYIDPTLPGVHTFVRPGAARGAERGAPNEVFTGADRQVVDNFDRYLTDEFADKAVDFIQRTAKKEPFFLYLAFNAPHDPLQVTQKYYDRFPHIENEMQRIYAGMVSAVDDGVGRVLEALEAAGVADDTLVVFLTDNGCAAYYPELCACEPMRGGKLTHFEGGTRVPFITRWSGRFPAGKVYEHPVSSLDIFPTALAAAGVPLPSDRVYDGVDLAPYVTGTNTAEPHSTLYWWRSPMRSVRSGDWKLWVSEQGDVKLLYDLGSDPNERQNLYDQRPDKVKELTALLDEWHADKVPPAWPSRPHTRYEACEASFELPI
jgi:arylsulfatase A-like enzyme